MNDTESGRRVPDIDLFERSQSNGALIGAHEPARNGRDRMHGFQLLFRCLALHLRSISGSGDCVSHVSDESNSTSPILAMLEERRLERLPLIHSRKRSRSGSLVEIPLLRRRIQALRPFPLRTKK